MTHSPSFQLISPVDGEVLLHRSWASAEQIDAALEAAQRSQLHWSALSLSDRVQRLHAWVDGLLLETSDAALELTLQMGRPLAQAPGELRGFEERARAMLDFAPDALRDWQPPERSGFQRRIQREPLGTVLVLAPWNYPYLTAVNTLIPALAAGNSVLLKHSDQVPLCAERLERTARAAGLPEGVLQVLHAHHDDVARMVADPRVHFVAFTGSNEGGAAVARAAAAGMAGLSLELGGKDAAYVAEDADLARAAESLVDGAFFNSGQSCCGIERVYVHQRHFEVFLHDFLKQTRAYRLGDPRQPETNLGPMARARNAEQVRAQLEEAERSGAQLHIDPQPFGAEALGPAYLAPQVVTGVAPEARLMREETFGPVVVIQPVGSDEEALRCMEDSAYGLTASIWTQDPARARSLGAQLTVGTVFMNRCDYLDPSLAWVGVKASGRGYSLSPLGYQALTRPKSFHFRLT